MFSNLFCCTFIASSTPTPAVPRSSPSSTFSSSSPFAATSSSSSFEATSSPSGACHLLVPNWVDNFNIPWQKLPEDLVQSGNDKDCYFYWLILMRRKSIYSTLLRGLSLLRKFRWRMCHQHPVLLCVVSKLNETCKLSLLQYKRTIGLFAFMLSSSPLLDTG